MFTEYLLSAFLEKMNLNGKGTSSTVTGEKKLMQSLDGMYIL